MKEKIASLSVLSNVFLASSKIIIGFISGSTAVLADGVHSVMDVVSSAISLIGIRKSREPADSEHPYGHYKFEVLSGLFITVILFMTGLGIIYESFLSLLHPQAIEYQKISMITMGISASLNEIMARLKIHFGKKENSMSLLSDGVHSRVDVYTSVAVFVGLILDKYWIYADSSIALLIGVFILKESITLGKESTDSLLDVSAGEEIENEIRSTVNEMGIKLKELKTQKKGPVVTANLKISLSSDISVEKATKTTESLKKKLVEKIENLEYISIQIEGHDIKSSHFKKMDWEIKGKKGAGPQGYCLCPNCGYRMEHQRNTPCATTVCPKCGSKMEREGVKTSN